MSAKVAIIIAAGRGSRLAPYTDESPKCLVPVAGESILMRQLTAFARAGVERAVIVCGYRKESLVRIASDLPLAVTLVENDDYRNNNVLHSLFYAAPHIEGEVLISYSDIIFTDAVAAAAVASDAEIGLVVDRDFASAYEGRTDHPLSEAEVVAAGERVEQVGKCALAPEAADGEFIGLLKLSPAGARRFRESWQTLLDKYSDWQAPYQRAKHFRNAYLSDFLQDFADNGVTLSPIWIDGQWREIDTAQDLARADALLAATTQSWGTPSQ